MGDNGCVILCGYCIIVSLLTASVILFYEGALLLDEGEFDDASAELCILLDETIDSCSTSGRNSKTYTQYDYTGIVLDKCGNSTLTMWDTDPYWECKQDGRYTLNVELPCWVNDDCEQFKMSEPSNETADGTKKIIYGVSCILGICALFGCAFLYDHRDRICRKCC